MDAFPMQFGRGEITIWACALRKWTRKGVVSSTLSSTPNFLCLLGHTCLINNIHHFPGFRAIPGSLGTLSPPTPLGHLQLHRCGVDQHFKGGDIPLVFIFCNHNYVMANSWSSCWEELNLKWVCACTKAFQTDSEFYLASAYHGKNSSKGIKELVQLHTHLILVKAKPQIHYFNPQLLNCLKEFTALGNSETF